MAALGMGSTAGQEMTTSSWPVVSQSQSVSQTPPQSKETGHG